MFYYLVSKTMTTQLITPPARPFLYLLPFSTHKNTYGHIKTYGHTVKMTYDHNVKEEGAVYNDES